MEPKATRRRGAALEEALLTAAWEVLVEQGYAGFTYEAVAARASTSRPVLYRRWPQRTDMLLATLRRFWEPIAVPDTGTLREDAISYLHNANAGRARTITTIGAQLMEYFRETGTNIEELRDQLRPSGQPSGLHVIVTRAVERGELAEVPRPSRVVDLPFDLLRGEVLMRMGAAPEESIREIVDDVWLPLLRGCERHSG